MKDYCEKCLGSGKIIESQHWQKCTLCDGDGKPKPLRPRDIVFHETSFFGRPQQGTISDQELQTELHQLIRALYNNEVNRPFFTDQQETMVRQQEVIED